MLFSTRLAHTATSMHEVGSVHQLKCHLHIEQADFIHNGATQMKFISSHDGDGGGYILLGVCN